MYVWLGTRTCMSNSKTLLYIRHNTPGKRRILCLKQSIVVHTYTLILCKNSVIICSFQFILEHIYTEEYAPWQYERMPHKSMVNRLIRTERRSLVTDCMN